MKNTVGCGVLLAMAVVAPRPTMGQPADTQVAAPEVVSNCARCHGESELWEGDRRRLYVNVEHLAGDLHWKLGLQCHDCHGGNAETTNFLEAHSADAKFRTLKTPADVHTFCGHCHSNIQYMTRFKPSPKTNQVAEYLTSGHGKQLIEKNDPQVATCVSCHGGHGMRRIDDPQSSVYPTNVATTCGKCHSDPKQMEGREYAGHPLGHDQLEKWSRSVHADRLLKHGDLSGATCNDCHGNHGTVVPNVEAIANACGSCHVKVAEFYNGTRMKHTLTKLELPGCVACHGHHEIRHPTDELLGMGDGGACAKCHQDGKFGATLAGKEAAQKMRSGLESLKQQIALAQEMITRAEKLGMEVRGPQFDLRDAHKSLIHSRTLVHSFAFEPMNKELSKGMETSGKVIAAAQNSIDEYTRRRIWLAVSLVPIFAVVALLILYIRGLPLPASRAH